MSTVFDPNPMINDHRPMTLPDYTENWRRYWAQVYESGRRLHLENAAAYPLTRWLIADVPLLLGAGDDGMGIEAEHLRTDPDAVFAAAREGFEVFVDDFDLPRPANQDVDYDSLPIHPTGVGLVSEISFAFTDPVKDANRLTRLDNVRITDELRTEVRAGVLTYRCPQDHETVVEQSLYDPWTIETCGNPDCSNEVTLDHTHTYGRRVVTFTSEVEGNDFSCIATGRYAGPPDDGVRFTEASRVEMTGIPRLVTDPDGTVRPVFQMLHAEEM